MPENNKNEADISEIIIETLKKLNENIISKLREWGKVVQLKIDDLDYYIDFKEKPKFTLRNGQIESYNFKLSSSSDIFYQIIRQEINPVEAVVSGEVTIEGNLTNAMEFSEIMSQN